MRVRTFKPEFAALVKAGTKRQTIRPIPTGYWPKIGDHESWREWSGRPYYSRTVELAQVELTQVRRIELCLYPTEDVVLIGNQSRSRRRDHQGWKLLPIEQMNPLAVADGFADFNAMAAWFRGQYGQSFSGILIQAKSLLPTVNTHQCCRCKYKHTEEQRWQKRTGPGAWSSRCPRCNGESFFDIAAKE